MPEPTPELKFQKHIADFLIREHGYGKLEDDNTIDPEHGWVEDHVWAFLVATQSDALARLVNTTGWGRATRCFAPCARNCALRRCG